MNEIGSITAHGLSKSFYRYRSDARRFLSCLWPSIRPDHEHKVLQDISFTIQPGQALGIVGHNGAGKSTLLKVLTGTLAPSAGSVRATGRIAAILELGMGFNHDLNATENVMHVGGMMGLTHDELMQSLPAIREFAEVGEHFDQPLRLYSSGMQVRVAFALATAIRPDILIVDEALSVGDMYFQHKSFERIKQFQEQGTTLLFVSHDASSVLTLCDRCILLSAGQLLMDGEPSQVMDYYNALIAEKDQSVEGDKTIQQEQTDSGVRTRSGTGEMQLTAIDLFVNNQPVEILQVGQATQLRIRAICHKNIKQLVFGYMIKDRLGQPIFGTNTFYTDNIIHNVKAGDKLNIHIDFPANIGVGNYSITTAFSSGKDHLGDNYEWLDRALVFQVLNNQHAPFVGSAWIPPTQVVIEQHPAGAAATAVNPATP